MSVSSFVTLKKVHTYGVMYNQHLKSVIIDRHTKIFDSQDELMSNGYIDASKIDLYATKWFNKDNINVGLIAH
jgi:hypothetical protein